ncbi:MAG: hypothetical protein QXF79_03755, partial [Ignisphaera sp.]
MGTHEFAAIIILFVFGYLARSFRFKEIKRAVDLLNKFLIYSIAPLTIFVGVYSKASQVIFALIGLCIIHAVLVMVLTFSISVLASGHKNSLDLIYAMVISMGIPNSGFLAIPLAIVVFGTYFNIIPYIVAANVILPFVLLVLTISLKFERKPLLISMIPISSLVSLVLAILFKFLGIVVPEIIMSISNIIVSNVSFVFFLILGYKLVSLLVGDFSKYVKWVTLGYIIKYVASPMLMYILLMFTINRSRVILEPQYIRGLLLQSFMPSALFNIVIGDIFKLESKLISILMVLQTLTSIVITLALFT